MSEASIIEATIQSFSISLEARFFRPKPFSKERVDAMAEWLTDPATGLELRAEQVRARHNDLIFDYEVNASFYGGNATFHADPDKAIFQAQRARTKQDADFLRDTCLRYLDFMMRSEMPSAFVFGATALAHVSTQDVENFTKRLRTDEKMIHPCALAYLRLDGWPELIRTAIEPILGVPEGLFFTWNMNLPFQEDWSLAFNTIVDSLIEASACFGVTFRPLS